MLQFPDHADAAYVGEHLRAMHYVAEYEDHRGSAGTFDQTAGSDNGVRHTDQGRRLDEIGAPVVGRVIPDFWKPIEDWMID